VPIGPELSFQAPHQHQHIEQPQEPDDLKKLNKQKKLVKKLAKKSDAFLASESLIKQIPRLLRQLCLRPGLNKAGKFPSLLSHGDNFDEKIKDLQSTIPQIPDEEGFVLERCHRKPRNGRRSAGAKHSLVYQFRLSISWVSLLKKHWQNIHSRF